MLLTRLSRRKIGIWPSPLLRNLKHLHGNAGVFPPVDQSFEVLLKKCSTAAHIHQAHCYMLVRALDHDNILLNRFVATLSALGFSDYVYFSVFFAPNPDMYLYNTAIDALARQPRLSEQAISLYKRARVIGLKHDTYSIPFVLSAVIGDCGLIFTGRQIHCEAVRAGLNNDVHVGVSLVRTYSSCGLVSDARKVFDEMLHWDVALWNAIIAGYAKAGDMGSAADLFQRMPRRNVVSWTTIITGYAQGNQSHDAIAVFRRMMADSSGVKPDEVAMLAALSACANLGDLELGSIQKAVQLFESMTNKNVVTWSTLISGLATNGLGREALDMFSRMEGTGIKPNDVTLIAVLSACSHAGFVELGRWYFYTMEERYGIQPNIKHYGCIIDLLGRSGRLQEAEDLSKRMPFEANAAIWGSLLAASRNQANAGLGERALRHLLKVEPHNSGNYSLLSSIYASLGRWDEARASRIVMRDIGVRKKPGQSSIEVENRAYDFNSEDRSHPQLEGIYRTLLQLNEHLKMSRHTIWDYDHLLDSVSV
ncbi:pentatricopeptide repeat-containing protein At5g56310 isoform X2 [Ipomoea triloba]|uniref:pentatricopeptide repeat-containing protein At5g56310 isoform X2 n=1 Tax=Ipomoea triloba TaxID=35885 RepID=UPI00125D4584|nr:pentatricopeptide repeat-containing protein At5g56310 isoform X2 [Ipomoea triloba]